MILLVSQRCGFDALTSLGDDRITLVAEIRDGKKKINQKFHKLHLTGISNFTFYTYVYYLSNSLKNRETLFL